MDWGYGYCDYYSDCEMPSEEKHTDPVRDAVLKQLQKEAEERTWNMYEELEKHDKLSNGLHQEYLYLKHQREQNPNIDLTVFEHDMLLYYFSLGRDSPYRSLCIQRYRETGERMPVRDRDQDFYVKEYRGDYNWTLEKDKQYILLHEKVSSYDELQLDVSSCETLFKAMTVMLDEKLCVAKEIAKTLDLNLLDDIDIKQCFTDFVWRHVSMIHFDQTREMYLYLLNEDVQKRIVSGDKSSVLMELNRKFKLRGGIVGIELGLDYFWRWVGFSRIDAMVKKKKKKKKKKKMEASASTLLCQKMEEISLDPCPNESEEPHDNWVRRTTELIEEDYKEGKEGYIMNNGFVEYLSSKIKFAIEIGIVIKDGEVWREKGWEEFPLD